MQGLVITYRDPASLKPSENNARVHSAQQIRQIARSMKAFGALVPLLVDADDNVIAGHGRREAAIEAGLSVVPTVRIEHLSEAQKRAFMIADNRLGDLSTFDERKLAIELEQLQVVELDFEITDTGFEIGEIDRVISDLHEPDQEDPADQLPDANQVRSVARAGDLWKLGKHLLFCGDALDPLIYRILLDGASAQMIFTDPPYNVPIQGHVSGLGKARHGEFAMASGELTSSEFTAFLRAVFQLMARSSDDGAIHFICMDGPHLRELLNAAADIYSTVKNICVWDKKTGGMGSLYRSQTELVAVLKHGTAPHTNNVQLGRFGRNRTTLWRYPGLSSFQSGRDKTLAMHPTVKPIALIGDAILDCSKPKDIVLDPFAGSGSTLIAAERTGRRGFGIEIDPRYVDVTLQRYVEVTGIKPVNLWTGQTLSSATARKANGEAGR